MVNSQSVKLFLDFELISLCGLLVKSHFNKQVMEFRSLHRMNCIFTPVKTHVPVGAGD